MSATDKSPMEQAKQAVEEFMAKAGHHDTTVHERVAPAVTHETVTRTEHEELTTAIDKEIHQNHYHTSLQPIHDEFILDETHRFNLIAVEHRSFNHDDEHEVKRRLAEEAAKFKDEIDFVEGKHTNAVLPLIAGEHIHHHVHETIQPIVHKQTIVPHIIHTTIPIHEVHHNAAQHHLTSALPAVTMADFKKQGGVLTGREERYDGFEGEPRSVGKALGGNNSGPTSSQMGTSGLKGSSTDPSGSNNNAAPTAAAKTAATGAGLEIPPFRGQHPSLAHAPTQGAGSSAAAGPSTTSTAPQPSRTAPLAPPLPAPHALAPVVTHRAPTGIATPPTYLSQRAYLNRHPAGTTGARPAPTMTSHPETTRVDEDDDS